MIVPLARMDAASRLRMLEGHRWFENNAKRKTGYSVYKSSFKIRLILYFCIHSSAVRYNSDYLQIVPENLLISELWWEFLE